MTLLPERAVVLGSGGGALTIAAGAPVVPPSPPALMPSGLVGDNTSTISVVKEGSRCARGMP